MIVAMHTCMQSEYGHCSHTQGDMSSICQPLQSSAVIRGHDRTQYPCRQTYFKDLVRRQYNEATAVTRSLSRKELPLLQIMGKVEVVPGDLAQPQCGISPENQERLLPEVHYVIHAAASIQFDNPIHIDLALSYVATKTIADFAAKVMCPKLCGAFFMMHVHGLRSGTHMLAL